jgi:hypothetical protein
MKVGFDACHVQKQLSGIATQFAIAPTINI